MLWYSYNNALAPIGPFVLVAVPDGQVPSEANIEPMFIENPQCPHGPIHMLHRWRRDCARALACYLWHGRTYVFA